MGKDRNNSEISADREDYDQELNFTAQGDDLFDNADTTFDMDESNAEITPVGKYKEENLETK